MYLCTLACIRTCGKGNRMLLENLAFIFLPHESCIWHLALTKADNDLNKPLAPHNVNLGLVQEGVLYYFRHLGCTYYY